MADVVVQETGSNFLLFEPQDDRVLRWLLKHVDGDSLWHGRFLAVEHRYAPGLLEGLKEAGFTASQA
jgi:hypothetical protein